ncbi:hypothetical protein [Streptomyces sp. NPDC057002]|uniref:hypothetical protein n=1 Tax=Streptomyces sp. NPDC057002 TaxID=3345992 RepID=UPI00362D1186
MKVKIVSSAELAANPWGAVHHFPSDPTPEGERLVRAFGLVSQMREAHPEEASEKNWDEAEALFRELAEKRSRQFRTGTVEQRAKRDADVALFRKAGLLPPRADEKAAG